MACCSSRVLRWTPRRSCFSVRPANQRSTRLSQERAGRREVQMKARMTQQPALDGRGFVGAVIIEDQVESQRRGTAAINRFQEARETPPRDGGDETAPITVPALKSSAANRLIVP